MKKLISYITLFVLIMAGAALNSCKKSSAPKPASTLPPVISQGQMDSLKKLGTLFNPGTSPPTVSGEFFYDPVIFSYDNSGLNLKGLTGDSYVFKFSNQNSSKGTVDVAFRDVTTLETNETGADTAASYISGSGQLFTIYARESGTSSSISFTSLQIISGQLTPAGIANMQVTTELLSKNGDPGNDLLYPVGTINITYDGDKLSVPYTGTITFNAIKAQALRSLFSVAAKKQ